MSFIKSIKYILTMFVAFTMMLNAQTPEEKGLEIAIEADKRDLEADIWSHRAWF